MRSSIFSKPKDQFVRQPISFVKDRKISGAYHFSGIDVFIASDDKQENYGKRILLTAKDKKSEVKLDHLCHFVKCSEKLLFCGAISGPISVVSLEQLEVIATIKGDFNFQNSCVLPLKNNNYLLICRSFSSKQISFYECTFDGFVKSLGTENFSQIENICFSDQPQQFFMVGKNRMTKYQFDDGRLKKLVSSDAKLAAGKSFHHLTSSSQDVYMVRRKNGYILVDRNSNAFEIRDDKDNVLALFDPREFDYKKVVGEKFEWGEFHVLADGKTFIANFADYDHLNKVVIFTLSDLKLKLELHDVGVQIHRLAIDEEQDRLMIATKKDEAMCIANFRNLFLAEKKSVGMRPVKA